MTAPRVKRTNRGGGHSYTIDGEKAPGVTTLLRDGIPKPAFATAAARNVAGYAIDHWDELAALTPSKRLRQLEKAQWAERDAAALRGTAVHRFAEQLARGDDVEVPDESVGMVDAYLEFIRTYRVAEVATEAVIVNYTHRYCGTLDLLATIGGDVDALWLIDWKTGQSGIWPEVALQLAAYAHAEAMVVAGVESPMPKIAHAAAVWLRADGFDVYPIDISEATFRTFLYAQQVAEFTNAERATYVRDALPRVAVDA
jgi:hypothetical protein